MRARNPLHVVLTLRPRADWRRDTGCLSALERRQRRGTGQVGLYLALDMDTGDGPCADIDGSVAHGVGDNYNIGVCIGGMSTALGTIQSSVYYDDTLNSSPT